MTHHHEIPYRNMNEYEFHCQEEILRQALLENFLQAMREDLSEWLSSLSPAVFVSADSFLSDIENGILLCQHARLIQRFAEEYSVLYPYTPNIPTKPPSYKERGAFPGSFVARDNVANFIAWCRELGIADVVIFESDDLVMGKNEKSVILTLMEIARKAYIFGVQPPEIVRFEKEIDEEIDKEKEAVMLGKPPQKPRDLEEDNNLDTMVRNIVNKCQCCDRFPIKKLAEGKYQVGRNNALIFVRVMRKHVMVRVGGGWDTFDHYITKHDPCRTKVMGTINDDGHSKSVLSTETDTKLTTKLFNVKAEPTVATSTDTSSMCSSSSDGSEGICGCDEKSTCSHSNNSFDCSSNNENNDPCTNFSRSIEEIDRKLRLLADKRPSLDTAMKDPSVYNNKSDRWLRSHLNTIKQNTMPNIERSSNKDDKPEVQPETKLGMERGYTADMIDRRNRNNKDSNNNNKDSNNNNKNIRNNNNNGFRGNIDSSTPRALRRKVNTSGSPAKPRSKSQQETPLSQLRHVDTNKSPHLRTSYDQCDSPNQQASRTPTTVTPNTDCTQGSSNLSDLSAPLRRSCNNMSTQTDFDDVTEVKSSKIPRALLRNSDASASRIPRPVITRAKTLDSMPSRKKKNAKDNTTPTRTPASASDRPGMRREKSDVAPSMRREKSNLTSRNKKTTPRAGNPTPRGNNDKSRVDGPVKIRNGPELRC